MKILQFAFDSGSDNPYLPHNHVKCCVVYTGTHDNNTTVGWWESDATENERRSALEYFGEVKDGIQWAFIRAAFASVATLAVVPVQDVLGLDGEARMNIPSKPGGNWSWRLAEGALTPELANKLAALTELTDRDSCVKVATSATDSPSFAMSAEFAA